MSAMTMTASMPATCISAAPRDARVGSAGAHEHMLDVSASCPACGDHDTLIALGERIDHPHRWQLWARARTAIYLCASCDALVEARRADSRP